MRSLGWPYSNMASVSKRREGWKPTQTEGHVDMDWWWYPTNEGKRPQKKPASLISSAWICSFQDKGKIIPSLPLSPPLFSLPCSHPSPFPPLFPFLPLSLFPSPFFLFYSFFFLFCSSFLLCIAVWYLSKTSILTHDCVEKASSGAETTHTCHFPPPTSL